ncbi:unnamed protein product [Chrysoparadoxa australica]
MEIEESDVEGLWLAAEGGQLAVLQELIAKGTDLNPRRQRLPLEMAARGGHLSCVRALLEAGALVDGWERGGSTPLHGAAENGHLDVVKLLLDYRAGLERATRAGHWTPLMWAANSSNAECAIALLEGGASMVARDFLGCSALHHAACRGLISVVHQFLLRRANPDMVENNGETPAVYSRRMWAQYPDDYTELPLERRRAVQAALNAASQRNALWRGRRVVVMLEARHVLEQGRGQPHGVTGGDASLELQLQHQGDDGLRRLVRWLLGRRAREQQALFRLVVSYLGETFVAEGGWDGEARDSEGGELGDES